MFTLLLILQLLVAAQAQWGGSGSCRTPDQKSGFCIVAQTCKTMSDFLNKTPRPISPDVLKKLKGYKCGATASNTPKICCPAQAIEIEDATTTTTTTTTTTEQTNNPDVDIPKHRNRNLLPEDCGHLDTVSKIVNGNKTGIFEFPWMALLSYQTGTGTGFKCGGTILNQNYILTAAHCVTNLQKSKLKLIGVRVGEHNINTVNDCEEEDDGSESCAPPFQDLSIKEVIHHKKFNTQTNSDDIALIRVSPIDLTQENSRPVCLPFDGLGNFNYSIKGTVTGWGATETYKPSPELLKAALQLIPPTDCQKKYGKRKLLPTQLCAGGTTNSDSCGGDSGGPLHTVEIYNDVPSYIQQGIVSFGPRACGQVPLPGVYTRVSSYLDWILDNIKP